MPQLSRRTILLGAVAAPSLGPQAAAAPGSKVDG